MRGKMATGNVFPNQYIVCKWAKRDYEQVAKIITRCPDPDSVRAMAADFAQMFAEDNPRFDSARFATACGLGQFEALHG
jgi:hypothetical protein